MVSGGWYRDNPETPNNRRFAENVLKQLFLSFSGTRTCAKVRIVIITCMSCKAV